MEASIRTPIAVLGAGSWGTALALYLSRLGQEVRLWTFEADHVEEMLRDRTNNRYMPGYPFPDTLHPMASLAEAIAGVDDILIAVPSVGYRNTVTLLKPLLNRPIRILSATKGLDLDTGELLHEVARQILMTDYPYAVLSGPSFAREVAAGLPTAIVIASQDEAFARELKQRFNSPIFRVYLSTDIVGVEIGGVAKNVLAIACGISDGIGFGINARSALITRGLAEIIRLGVALGGDEKTFIGLSGLGDLILTCTDDQSRNRRFGLAFGKGKNAADVEREIGQVVEGKRNAELVAQLAKKHNVDMPITNMVWEILQNKLSSSEAMQQLLARPSKDE